MTPETAKQEQFNVDKSEWGPGPWQFEPDRLDFEHRGLPCLLRRGPGGHWCGYVGVAPGHPLYRKEADNADLSVHGGITYAHECAGSICHVPRPGTPDEVWWIGFDCAHAGDLTSLSLAARLGHTRYYNHAQALAENTWHIDTYRTLEYVKAETERLAEQLLAMHAKHLAREQRRQKRQARKAA
jgi:hypothetical protein